MEYIIIYYIYRWNHGILPWSIYRHLSILNGQFTWFLRDRNPYKAYLSKTDTSIIRTLIPVPLVSVIKRFDTINNPSHKKTINKFRLGNHRLRVETGRNTIPKTPENLRICLFCHLDEVENELHFILNCHLYDNLRSKFFEDIIRKYPHFNDFDDISKIFFLFNYVDPTICRLTAAYIHSCMNYRQTLII